MEATPTPKTNVVGKLGLPPLPKVSPGGQAVRCLWSTRCKRCKRWVYKGQVLVLDRHNDGHYYHPDCYAAMRSRPKIKAGPAALKDFANR